MSRGALTLIFALVLGLGCTLMAPAPAPRFEQVRARWQPSDARLLDRNGEVLARWRVDFSARRAPWVSLDAVSPALIDAVIAVEDRRFRSHHGIDARAIVAALWQAVRRAHELRGASTLTMQLAGLLDDSLRPGSGGRRSVGQKLAQLGAAVALEWTWSKDEILEAYLNLAPARGDLRGLGALARGLFDKSPAGLDRDDALLIATLLAAPGAAPADVAARACRLADSGDRRSCARLRERAAAAFGAQGRRTQRPGEAPPFARLFATGPGSAVRTTLDAGVQRAVAGILRARLDDLDGRNARDGAALVVDNRTGDVLAWVGSAGAQSRAAAVDGVLARRQAGSTLKPFLYGLALERRYLSAATLLDDAPVALSTGTGLYVPQNYDREFRGLVSVRTALAGSLNIPAVRTLQLVGTGAFHARLRAVGYAGLVPDPEHYGWSLALGAADVSLLEQVTAYRALALGGRVAPVRLLPGRPTVPGAPVMAAGPAYIVGDILSDPAGRSVTFGLAGPLATRSWSAVKTGTSKDMRDNWCIGYSQRYTVGVWVGNFEGDAMRGVSGVSGAAPAWLDIMQALAAGAPEGAPPPPDDLVAQTIEFDDDIEPPRQEWFVRGTELDRVHRAEPTLAAVAIAEPPDGLIVALDPDIPMHRQRLTFRASVASDTLRWRLNGRLLPGPAGALRWAPVPGRFQLDLEDASGRRRDTVHFEVRGRAGRRDGAELGAGSAASETNPVTSSRS